MVAVLLAAGCARAEPSATPGQLLREYAGASAPVKNDRFGPSGSGSGADRMANFAAHYTPDQLAAALFGAYECDDRSPDGGRLANPCRLSREATEAAREFSGNADRPHARSILVKHADGSLELLTVFIARRPDGEAQLIDTSGGTYTGLEDFRSGNDVLGTDDLILTLQDVTSVPGQGELVVRTGHTPAVWPWVASGAAGAVLVALITLTVIRRRRAAAENADLLAQWAPEKPNEPATPPGPEKPVE
ncbi:hypothetical protein Acsp02_76800 [Actinoplanes sp. NBRC 103695]|nr:hypothetical protein Acsp02_76800 [Actinoplanes sp. NBRC 103695]